MFHVALHTLLQVQQSVVVVFCPLSSNELRVRLDYQCDVFPISTQLRIHAAVHSQLKHTLKCMAELKRGLQDHRSKLQQSKDRTPFLVLVYVIMKSGHMPCM